MELIILSVIIGLHFIIEVGLGNSARACCIHLDQEPGEASEPRWERLGAREFATGLLPLMLLPAGLGLLGFSRVAGLAVLLLGAGLLALDRATWPEA